MVIIVMMLYLGLILFLNGSDIISTHTLLKTMFFIGMMLSIQIKYNHMEIKRKLDIIERRLDK